MVRWRFNLNAPAPPEGQEQALENPRPFPPPPLRPLITLNSIYDTILDQNVLAIQRHNEMMQMFQRFENQNHQDHQQMATRIGRLNADMQALSVRMDDVHNYTQQTDEQTSSGRRRRIRTRGRGRTNEQNEE